jgi:hypothetical protein
MVLFFDMDELRQFIKEHQNDDVRALALQAGKYSGFDFQFALRQIAGWQIARQKLPSWAATEGLVYPPHLSMEQCSSELTAMYKAALCSGERLTDLTGGFGIDCAFMSVNFQSSCYVERNEELCKIAEHNFKKLQLPNVSVNCAEAADFLANMPRADVIYLDPARRDKNGKKTVSIGDCEPDVTKLKDLLLLKAGVIWVKFSPMLDLNLALKDIPEITEAHVVAVNNECKELLLKIVQDGACGDVKIVCANLKKAGEMELFAQSRSDEETAACLYADRPDVFLYEPNVAILKGGLYKSVSEKFGVKKLHRNSHLYTSEELVEEFPGRKFRVLSVFSMNKKELKRELADVSKANVSVRNFPLSVEELRKKLKLKEGGDIYIFATTLRNGDKVLVKCVKC